MCGIAGFVAKQGALLPNSSLIKMTDLIHHRGPDDEGYIFLSDVQTVDIAGGKDTPDSVWKTKTEYQPVFHNNNFSKGHSFLAFGHRRLSILDLTPAGHQPMSYRNGEYWIIFNGEIYNYLNIRRELEAAGHTFTTKSDTETILAAYSEWGEGCLDRFVGMWAFAIYDRAKTEIFLSRDRYGIKPLYYYFSSDGGFYFASEIKQFTMLSDWRSRLNNARVYDQLVYSFTDHTDETMFSGVFNIPAGCSFRSSIRSISRSPDGRVKTHKWYNPILKSFPGSFNDAAETFKLLFERAVKEHLHADVPVGTALSGGLDSSSIVCEVNRILDKDNPSEYQKTFSSCSSYEQYNEKKWMDIVINNTKVDAYFVFPSLDDVFKLTSEILWYHDEPYQSQSAFLAFNLFNLAKTNNVKVLLNGQGADEYLGGYGQFTGARYAGMVRKFRIISMLEDLKRSRAINHLSTANLLLGVASQLLPTALKRAFSHIKSSSDNVKKIVNLEKLGLSPTHPLDVIPVPYRTVPEISKHLTFYSTLPKYLHWEDRNSMANSVEARVPFLDHRLVEFACSLPDDFLEKDGINKRVMREAMSGLLPEVIKNRKDKMGFTTPEEMWVKKENPAIFRKKLSEAIQVSNGIIKEDVLKYFDNVVSGKLPFDYTYWRLILFSEWVQKFNLVL